MSNYFQGFLDSAVLVQNTVIEFKNGNDPNAKANVAFSMTKVLTDFGVPAVNAPAIGGVFSDAVEAAAGGDAAPADIINDFNTELQNHHLVLPAIAQYFLMAAITQAITMLRGLITGKK